MEDAPERLVTRRRQLTSQAVQLAGVCLAISPPLFSSLLLGFYENNGSDGCAPVLALGKGPCRNGHSHIMSEMASSPQKIIINQNKTKIKKKTGLENSIFWTYLKKGTRTVVICSPHGDRSEEGGGKRDLISSVHKRMVGGDSSEFFRGWDPNVVPRLVLNDLFDFVINLFQ